MLFLGLTLNYLKLVTLLNLSHHNASFLLWPRLPHHKTNIFSRPIDCSLIACARSCELSTAEPNIIGSLVLWSLRNHSMNGCDTWAPNPLSMSHSRRQVTSRTMQLCFPRDQAACSVSMRGYRVTLTRVCIVVDGDSTQRPFKLILTMYAVV